MTCSVAAVKSLLKCGHGFSHLELLWQDDMYDGVARLLVIFSDTPSDVTPPPLWLGGTFTVLTFPLSKVAAADGRAPWLNCSHNTLETLNLNSLNET